MAACGRRRNRKRENEVILLARSRPVLETMQKYFIYHLALRARGIALLPNNINTGNVWHSLSRSNNYGNRLLLLVYSAVIVETRDGAHVHNCRPA